MNYMKNSINGYTIYAERKDVSLWKSEISYKYLCKFSFTDILNKTYSIILTEEDILRLAESLYNYYIFGMKYIEIPFNSTTSNLNKYIFTIYQSDDYGDILTISQHNLVNQSILNMIKVEFNDVEGTEFSIIEFIYLIYYVFLYDIVDFSQMFPDFVCE